MFPRVAVDNLVGAVFEAVGLVGQGDIAEGYRVLLRGRRAALERDRNFEPWAEGGVNDLAVATSLQHFSPRSRLLGGRCVLTTEASTLRAQLFRGSPPDTFTAPEELEGRWDAAIRRYSQRYGVGRA